MSVDNNPMLLHLLFGVCFLGSWTSSVSIDKKTKLVMILIDGFRYDYVTISNIPGLQDIIKNGVTTEYVTPIFPSLSYPNYYTIATGLFAESHGFVGNYMYDRETKTSFLLGGNPESNSAYWWDEAEPLWTTSEKQGVKTAVYYWDRCQMEIHGTLPHHCEQYKGYPSNTDFQNALNDTISKFKKDEIGISFIYYELIDKTGHMYGPFSPQLNSSVEALDKILLEFRRNLRDNNLIDRVNILLISDHGMAPLTKDKEVKLYKYIDIKSNSDAAFPEVSILPIYPKMDQIEMLFTNLQNVKNAKVYRKENYPDEWHFKNHKRIPELLVVADEGYCLLENERGWDNYTFLDPEKNKYMVIHGMHGYDNKLPSMRSFFAAIGPDFKQGYLNPPIDEVDVYNIMCKVMHITPQPNNGTWNNVKNMLNEAISIKCKTLWILFISTIIILV